MEKGLQVTEWPFDKLKVNLLTRVVNRKGDWLWRILPLPESPYVLTLLGIRSGVGRRIFQNYHDILTDESNPDGAWNPNEPTYEEFVDLHEDIKKNGIKNTSTIRIGQNHIVGDGHHRLAVLFSLGEKGITLPDHQTPK